MFTMDDLNLHRCPIVTNLIHSYGHQIVYRAPYWLCDGAIKYIFNMIQTKLQMDLEAVDSIHGLVNKINGIVGDMTLAEVAAQYYCMRSGAILLCVTVW